MPFQTVWNGVTGRHPEHGISDYDISYCDLSDLSWEGEDRVIRQCDEAFADIGVEVQVRNQARVHLWYPEKFGVAYEPLYSTAEGIDNYLNQNSAFGIRQGPNEGFEVYAPFGYGDLFNMVVRPNPLAHNLPAVYYAKAERWRQMWPGLAIMPWPEA